MENNEFRRLTELLGMITHKYTHIFWKKIDMHCYMLFCLLYFDKGNNKPVNVAIHKKKLRCT